MATGIYIFMAASSTASVAALVSIYGVMMSKEQSISEFRQTWINELRDEIAEFLSITTHLANINTIIHPSQDILTSHYKILLNLNNISFKLQLRLNPDEYQPEINLIEEINNIVKIYPHLVKFLHPIKNGELHPTKIIAGTEKKIWWICPLNQNHEWKQQPYQLKGLDEPCPFCGLRKVCKDNNLDVLFPKIAKELHPEKNFSVSARRC